MLSQALPGRSGTMILCGFCAMAAFATAVTLLSTFAG
jgi:hypothetical protein